MDNEAKQELRRTWVAKCMLLGYTFVQEMNWVGETWHARDPQGSWVIEYEQSKTPNGWSSSPTIAVRLASQYDWFLAYKILRKLKVIDRHGLPPGQEG